MATITTVLKSAFPRANPAFVAGSVRAPAIMARYGITSWRAQCEVIAQAGHETMAFTRFVESMNYTAPRILVIFKARVKTQAQAKALEHNERALANHVYGGRNGNRPDTDDGFKNRGSGMFHHTFQDEMDRIARRSGLNRTLVAAYLRDAAHADAMWHAACSYVVDRGMLGAANAGDTDAFTRKLNGGTNGAADRRTLAARVGTVMGGAALEMTAAEPEAIVAVAGPATAAEEADSAEDRARKAKQAAPAGGLASSGGHVAVDQKPEGPDFTTAIIVGIVVALAIGVVAYVMARAAAKRRDAVEADRAAARAGQLALLQAA